MEMLLMDIPSEEKSRLTLVICTKDRAALLSSCLRSIFDEEMAKKRIIVSIVDNGSIDETGQVVHTFAQCYTNINYYREPIIGLSFARNNGLQNCTTEWIGFIDDDAKVVTPFLPRVLDLIEKADFDCFGGTYLPWYHFGRPKWIQDWWFTKSILRNDVGLIQRGQYLSGGIFFIKTQVLKDLEGFNTNLGMRGEQLGYGEEDDLQNRLRKYGYLIGYDPEIKILHCVLPYKLKFNWRLRVAAAHGKLWAIENNPSFTTIFGKLCKSFFGMIVKRLPNGIYLLITKKGFYWQNLLLLLLEPIYYYLAALKCITMKNNENA